MAGLFKAIGGIVAFMLIAGQTAAADEFAHVDRARLAEGVERLAAAWRIPIVIHDGATDDFGIAALGEGVPMPRFKPATPESLAVARLAPTQDPDRGAAVELGYADEPVADGSLSADILGEIKRRRR